MNDELIIEILKLIDLNKVGILNQTAIAKGLQDLLEQRDEVKKNIVLDNVMTRLVSKNTIFNEAVSFAECNSSRDFEDTKATFIGGVNWLKGYLESNES